MKVTRMANIYKHCGIIASLLMLMACTPRVKNPVLMDEYPRIYPDYTEVTIPVDIAPLNFNMEDEEVDAVDVTAIGTVAGEITARGRFADFDIDEWHKLTEQNKGGSILVTVCARKDGQWKQYKEFPIFVSESDLNDWGLTYRRIPPGFEVGGNIGMYQRDLHSFDEFAMMTETATPERCMNCHTANRADPSRITMQVRHEKGGTLVQRDGKQEWLNTKTDSTKAACSYAYWHPDGDYIAFSAAAVGQNFFVGTYKHIEVYHRWGNVVLLDTRTHELVTDERLMTTDWVEIFPAFSADGKTLYYSTSKVCELPAEFEKVKCSIVSMPFDVETGKFGEPVDTLLNGPDNGMSYVLARPSYDGKWLMYVRCGWSNFPIQQRDADLWIMDLQTKESKCLDIVNSNESDTYPNWSSNSRWFVFASKREDTMYTRLYLSSIDNEGNATKPFLLPQRNPRKYYDAMFDAYNVPDFTTVKVDFDIHEAQRQMFSDERINVTIRE